MPFLAIVMLAPARCPRCGAAIASPGSRSFVVDSQGNPAYFDPDDPPAEMVVEIPCPNGHPVTLLVPNEVSAEESLTIPAQAPIAADAVLRSGATESGAPI